MATAFQEIKDGLLAVRTDVLGVKEEVRVLKEYQRDQNGNVRGLKEASIAQEATLKERARWEERQAANFKWWMGAGLGAAGLMSGIVFGVLSAVTP